MLQERFSPEGLVLSTSYAGTMETIVLPWLEAHRKRIHVTGADGKPLSCSVFAAEKARGTIVIIHGFTENIYKFSELIYSLVQNQFSVAAYDQRGHGESWRDEKIKDLSLTHVDHFSEYVRDLEFVMDTIGPELPEPRMAFAHSMGGAVLSLYLEKHKDVFSRAVLCAPMIQANAGMPQALVKMMCRTMKIAGKGKTRVFISKPYTEKEAFETSSAAGRERFDWYEDARMNHEELRNNGPTYIWTLESLNVTKQILAEGKPEGIACPVRLYTAELDTMVMPEPQKSFIGRIKQGSHAIVKGAKHEIYRSDDKVLFPWWHDVLEFYRGNN